MSMIITNLTSSPAYIKDTLQLIEKSFDYSVNNKFKIDFYPLMRKENHAHCHIIIQDKKVVAHIGVLQKYFSLNNKSFSVSMYGGIAVDKRYRGQGLFKKLFNYVLEQNNKSMLHLLWSDQLEMYEQFNFFPAIEQFEHFESMEDANGFVLSSLNKLSDKDIKTLSLIYNNQKDLRIFRTLNDWDTLKGITSTDLYLKKENEIITNYFFINKGEDLNGIIIEAGHFNDFNQIKSYGITWSPTPLNESAQTLYASVVKIGQTPIFQDFISTYTKNKIEIIKTNKKTIEFKFENNLFNLNHHEFLAGIFGPNRFEELKNCLPLYISGLDSI